MACCTFCTQQLSPHKKTMHPKLTTTLLRSSHNSCRFFTASAVPPATSSSSSSSSSKAFVPVTVMAAKRNLPQSPWKMNFLVKLIRKAWVPDALAQLKFTPKHRAEDVAKIVRRAVSIAGIYHNTIPEELVVKEVICNKGSSMKRMRIMGRGRTGFGYKRYTHVTVKVEKINFDEEIAKSITYKQQNRWKKRRALVDQLKAQKLTASASSNSAQASA